MTNEEYFSSPALSKSQIKDWDSRNPARFWRSSVFNPFRKDKKETNYTAEGHLLHAYLFERSKVLDMFEIQDGLGKLRSNKKWIDAQAQTKKPIISTEEIMNVW